MATPDPSSGNQPKIVQKLLLRTALFLGLMAAVLGALQWVRSRQGDFDNGGESAGMVAAIQRMDNGQQAVLIKPDGAIVATKGWHEGVTDREPVWSPDGKFLFFASDRKDNTFHIYRWNPQSEDAQQRTEKGGSRSNPTFAPGETEGHPLIVAGGMVRELDPVTHKTPQVLPPANAEIAQSGSGDEAGTSGSLSIYGGLGNSFRIARYLPGRQTIAAILRRDEGEVLVLQSLTPVNDKIPRPIPIVAGDRIDFDVEPTNGQIVFSVQGFRWVDKSAVPEQYRKGNRITTPFRNMMGFADPKTGQQTLLGTTPTAAAAYGAPRVSPDGTRVLVVVGNLVEGALQPKALLTMPLRQAGVQQASPLAEGDVYEPSWSLDGSRILFAQRKDGKRDIISMKADGTDAKDLTQGKGDFANPLFSPMTK